MKQNILNGVIYENQDREKIIFVDDSIYINFPDNPKLDIKLPNSESIYSVPYKPNSISIISTETLGSTFPDGIYNIRQSCSPNEEVYRDFLYVKLDKINCELNNLHTSITEYDKNKIDMFYKADVLKEGIKAEVKSGNLIQAVEKYNLLLKILKKKTCELL